MKPAELPVNFAITVDLNICQTDFKSPYCNCLFCVVSSSHGHNTGFLIIEIE